MDNAMNEKMRKVSAIMLLSQNYGTAMPDGLLDTWIGLLEEYSATEVEKGVRKVIQSYEYKTRPPFAVLRKAIDKASNKMRIEPEESLDMQAEAEWDKLINAVARCGRYKKPRLHPTTEHVLRGMGGWDAACDWETSRLDFKRRTFIEKWKMTHDNEEFMELGADGVREMVEGPQSAREILGATFVKGAIEQ